MLSMKTNIGYLPVRLKRRPGSTQNEVKMSPALVTTQIPISSPFHSFRDPFWKPKSFQVTSGERLKGDNVSDLIVDSTKLIMLPFCDFTDAKRPTRHPPSDYYMAPVFPQTPFPEVRKLTKTTPAASLRDCTHSHKISTSEALKKDIKEAHKHFERAVGNTLSRPANSATEQTN